MSGESVVIVGPGRMGLALGYALVQSDAVETLTVFGRRPEPPGHPLFTQGRAEYVFGMRSLPASTTAVLLAVPDPVVPEIAHTLAGQGPGPEGCAAMHLSGTMSTDVLAPLHAAGYAVGALNVLQVLTHPLAGAEPVEGTPEEQYEIWIGAGVTHLLVEHGGRVHGAALDRVEALCPPGTLQVLDTQPGRVLVALAWDAACQERVMRGGTGPPDTTS